MTKWIPRRGDAPPAYYVYNAQLFHNRIVRVPPGHSSLSALCLSSLASCGFTKADHYELEAVTRAALTLGNWFDARLDKEGRKEGACSDEWTCVAAPRRTGPLIRQESCGASVVAFVRALVLLFLPV